MTQKANGGNVCWKVELGQAGEARFQENAPRQLAGATTQVPDLSILIFVVCQTGLVGWSKRQQNQRGKGTMATCKECKAGDGNHELWCSKLAEGVDTNSPLPPTEEEAKAMLSAMFTKMKRVAGSDALSKMALHYLLSREEYLRAKHPPDHVTVRVLDQLHAGELPWSREELLREE